MTIPLPGCRAAKPCEPAIKAGVLSIAILLASTAAAQTADPPAFPIEPESSAVSSTEPPALPMDPQPPDACWAEARALSMAPEPRSLMLAVESKVSREDATRSGGVSPGAERLTSGTARRPGRLEYPGRAWPFALAAAADAATTYWALGHGGSERNPLLSFGRVDMGMVKIVQFPLLAKAIDAVEARHPRLGRQLRWATLLFHAALAVNNVRLGLSARSSGVNALPRTRP